MDLTNPTILSFFALITTTGILTSFSDLTKKKIRNSHLLLIASIALILSIAGFLIKKTVPTLHLFSGIAGIGIAVLLFMKKIWRAGDAKLFALYSFLMLPTGYEGVLPLPCFSLFINTFLLGFFLQVPALISEIITQWNYHLKQNFSLKNLQYITHMFLITLTISWVVFPLLSLSGLRSHVFLSIVITYAAFPLIQKIEIFKKGRILGLLFLATGLFLRIYFFPEFFTVSNIASFFLRILCYSMVFQILRDIIEYKKKEDSRVPFAPYLFAGCLLSYTPFLYWLITFSKG